MTGKQWLEEYEELPLVSVILPVYNGEPFIEKTLNSILTQTYSNFEVLVIDDGSTDQTETVVTSFAQRDPRIKLLKQANAGVAAARNFGIQSAKGEFIAPIDADDLWFPDFLEKQVRCMLNSDSSVGLVYAWLIKIDQNGSPTGDFCASRIEGDVYPTLLCHDFIANASCVLIRRSCLQCVGGYDSSLKARNGQGCEDWDLYLRIAELHQIRVVPEFLVGYRQRSDSMSCNYQSMAQSRELIWETIRQKYPNIPAIIYRLSMSSFYMNLAHKCSCARQDKTALFWLCQAIGKDFITPWLRLGMYRILIRATFNLYIQNLPILVKKQQKGLAQPVPPSELLSTLETSQLADFYPPKTLGAISPKVLVEILLHRVLLFLLGTPKHWRTRLSKPQVAQLPKS
uniref:Glycosyl transferase family 2 n=1 Tax=Cyanothece sp. (strain PCC 7425 / ATCC 29141) TaxID=395961 RepID=B8HRA4_CYAP4